MANVTGAELNPIYQRLNQAPTYHPFDVDAFSDWSMEAGDIVTVSRGGVDYSSPVHVSRMTWKGGAPTVQISSTGNKEREPVSKISRKKYGRGSAGVRSQEGIHRDFTSEDGILHSELHVTESYLRTEFHNETDSLRSYFDITASHLRTEFIDEVYSLRSDFEITASHLRTEFTDDVNSLRSNLDMTASHLRTEFTDEVHSLRSDFEITASHLRTEFTDDVNSLRSNIDMTASHLRTEFTDDVNSVRSYVHQTASSWEMRVSGVVDANGNVTAASITAAVNNGGSNIYIEANKIHLLGQTIANTIDADYISSAIASIPVVNARSIYSSGVISSGGYVYADDFVIGVNGSGAQNNKYLHNAITELRITQSGNTYTLQKKDFDDSDWQDVDSFSRATTLTGVWGGTVAAGKTFIVTASPQGNVKGCKIYGSIVPDSSDPIEYTTSGNNHYVAQDHIIFTEDDHGDADVQILKKEVKISADLAYSDGYTTGYEEGAASGGTTTLTNTWNTGHLIVTANPQGETLDRWLSSGTATWNGRTVSIPINALWGNLQQYSESTGWSASVDVSGKLQSKTFSSNGTKTPDSGYIGFSSVSISVPAVDVDARFGASSGQYFIGAYDNASGNLISGSSHTYKLGTSGAKVQVQKSDGTKYSSTPELTLAIDSGTLNTSTGSRTLTVTAGGNDTTATLDITDYSAGESAGIESVTVSSIAIDGTITYASKTLTVPTKATASNAATKTVNLSVDATSAYNAGSAGVTLVGPSWNDVSDVGTSRTVTVGTSGRKNSSGSDDELSKSVTLHLTPGSWGGNKIYVYMREGTTSGTDRAHILVDATERYNDGWNNGGNTAHVYYYTETQTSVTPIELAYDTQYRFDCYYTPSGGGDERATASSYGRRYFKTKPDRYSNGWSAARGKLSVPTNAGTAEYLTIGYPPATVDGDQATQRYYVTADNSMAYIRASAPNGTIVARASHSAYSNGYGTGYNVGYTDGVTDGEGHGSYIVPVWGERYENNYNANAYASSGGSWVKKIYASATTGVHIPLSENGANSSSSDLKEIPTGGVVENGNYKFRSGYAGIRYFSVNVPSGSSHNTKYRMECLSKEASYPGASVYNYTFKLYSNATNFDTETQYNFYR